MDEGENGLAVISVEELSKHHTKTSAWIALKDYVSGWIMVGLLLRLLHYPSFLHPSSILHPSSFPSPFSLVILHPSSLIFTFILHLSSFILLILTFTSFLFLSSTLQPFNPSSSPPTQVGEG
ncbi:hypothetical protein M1146_03970 [Patescibacteria group bacterium]|nr:hypothetical protein [Patescibacteria group bacterium]